MTDSDPPPMKRLKLSRKDLEDLSKEDLVEKWMEQEQYVEILETRNSEGQKDSLELVSLRESEDKLRQQQLEATRRENLLVMRLAAKEQEMQECAHQIQELKQAQTPGSAQLRSTLLDPAVNLMFERMKKELLATKAKLEETQNELSAWKFTPDSNTGKRLMAKCRQLYQENEELGKMISSGRMAKLEGDLALQKNFSEEMKKSQAELDEFLLELDEDVEGMQSTILYLQQQLRTSKEQVTRLQSENQLLLTNASVCVSDVSMTSQAIQSPRSNSLLDCPRDSNPVSVGLSSPPTENHIETNGEHVVEIVDGVQTVGSASEVVMASPCSQKPPSPIVLESNGDCVTVCFEAESKDMPLQVHVDDTSQDFLGHGGSSPDRLDSTENTRTVDQIEELSSESLEPLILEETEPMAKEAVDLSTSKWVQLQDNKTVLTQDCNKDALVAVTVLNGTGDGASSFSEEDT